jgi:hypothetical protein
LGFGCGRVSFLAVRVVYHGEVIGKIRYSVLTHPAWKIVELQRDGRLKGVRPPAAPAAWAALENVKDDSVVAC